MPLSNYGYQTSPITGHCSGEFLVLPLQQAVGLKLANFEALLALRHVKILVAARKGGRRVASTQG
jgi:hypothetical protein